VTTESGGAFSGSVSITSPSDLVTLTCSATNYEPFSTTATLTCGSNSLGYLTMTPIVTAAPTINTIASIVVCGGSGGTVSLSGITDGNGGSALPITVSATSSNTSIIPNPSITYTSPNAAGTLTYTISGTPTNTATISVKITNSGSTFCSGVTTKIKTFSIQVKQPSTPTLNPVSNPAPVLVGSGNQTQGMSGITAGAGNPSGSLSVSATSSNPSVAGIVSVSYTNPSTLGSVTYSIGAAGTATITIAVTDGNAGRCGATNTFSESFTVTVVT